MGMLKDQEAQLMLLAGFIVAVGVVVTSMMFNSIAFISTGSVDTNSRGSINNLLQITGNEIQSAYRDSTAPGRNDSLKFSNFTTRMKNFEGNLSIIYAMRGESIELSWDINNWNDNRYARFTQDGKDGAANWTLAENVRNISVFKLKNVSGTDIEVILTNQTTGSFLWSMKLEGAGTILIENAAGDSVYHFADYAGIDLLNDSYMLNANSGNNISKVTIQNGNAASGGFNITGIKSTGNNFTRARDYVMNMTAVFSTARMRANITSPISVPW